MHSVPSFTLMRVCVRACLPVCAYLCMCMRVCMRLQVLYPLVELGVSADAIEKQAAGCTLRRLALYLGYCDLADMYR